METNSKKVTKEPTKRTLKKSPIPTENLNKIVQSRQLGQARGFIKEFKDFAFKGNMIDLAVGLIIGTAFNNLIQSFIKDIVMPPVGKLMGNVDFTDLYINLSGQHFNTFAEAEASGLPIVRYGRFITSFIDFIILALTVFIVLRFFLRYKAKEQTK